MLAFVLAACGQDVRLGSSAPDAGIDAQVPPADATGVFVGGSYALHFLDPANVDCEGSLAGSEGSFSGITRSGAGLNDGPVTLSMPSLTILAIEGAPIDDAFENYRIELIPNPEAMPPEFPQSIWDTSITVNAVGPENTQHTGRYFGLDASTADTPSAVQGAVALLYEPPAMDGSCFVTFGALLAQQ